MKKPQVRNCDECTYFFRDEPERRKSVCSLGHRPRFYMPKDFDFIGAGGNWGWKRKCADFSPRCVNSVEAHQHLDTEQAVIGSTPLFGIWTDAEKQKPEVGKKVIVCGQTNGNRWMTIATWQPAGTINASDWDDPPDDWWDIDGNVATNPTDEWSESPVEVDRSYSLDTVTHWTPLPDMPGDKKLSGARG